MRPLTGREMSRILQTKGWTLARVTGSHHIFTKEGELSHITVPIHGGRQLRKGTQAAIMKQAGLRSEDL